MVVTMGSMSLIAHSQDVLPRSQANVTPLLSASARQMIAAVDPGNTLFATGADLGFIFCEQLGG